MSIVEGYRGGAEADGALCGEVSEGIYTLSQINSREAKDWLARR
jgi:hypothetical protein